MKQAETGHGSINTINALLVKLKNSQLTLGDAVKMHFFQAYENPHEIATYYKALVKDRIGDVATILISCTCRCLTENLSKEGKLVSITSVMDGFS